MLKKERTKDLTVLETDVSNVLNDYMEEKNYEYHHHFILHSFEDEFIVKLFFYPRYENNKLSHVSNIYLSKEKKIIRLKSFLTNESIDIDEHSNDNHLKEMLVKIIKEYHYLLNIVRLNNFSEK